MTLRLFILLIALLLSGCVIPGMGPDPKIAQREEEAKAIGAGCRHGLRSIEDCYNQNEGISKAAIFTGWKDMDQYMRDNKIEGIRASAEPVETVVEGKNSKALALDKAAEAVPKADAKLPTKAASKSAATH